MLIIIGSFWTPEFLLVRDVYKDYISKGSEANMTCIVCVGCIDVAPRSPIKGFVASCWKCCLPLQGLTQLQRTPSPKVMSFPEVPSSIDWLMGVGKMSGHFSPLSDSSVRPCKLQSSHEPSLLLGFIAASLSAHSAPFPFLPQTLWPQGHSLTHRLEAKLRTCFWRNSMYNILCWAFYTEFLQETLWNISNFPTVTDEGVEAQWTQQLVSGNTLRDKAGIQI